MYCDATSLLPISEVLEQLKLRLQENNEVVLQAPPGAGKTTVVPLALLDQAWLGGRKILLLEPRRIAARAAAARMAQLMGEAVGQTVGYRIRMDSCVSDSTRIEVITEGILTHQLQRDPGLEDIGLVIFDEFHERNLDSDLCLALALHGRALFREGPRAEAVGDVCDHGWRRDRKVTWQCAHGDVKWATISGCNPLWRTTPVARFHHPTCDQHGAPGTA